MLNSELVSIILPTYNRLPLLKEAIQSVLNQTYTNFELIVVDDGSSDGTSTYVKNLENERIMLFSQENIGRSAARNLGLKKSRGELITFLDSDDLYLPTKLESQIDFLSRNKHFACIYTSADCFADSNPDVAIHRYDAKKSGNIYDEIAAYVPLTICLPTVMFRREVLNVIGLFDTELDRFEDTDYWRRIAQKFLIGAMDEVTCLIRTHEGNSILDLNTRALRKEVLKYGKKVLNNDSESHGPSILNLVSNFYRHYAWAIMSNTSSRFEGLVLYLRSELLHREFLFRDEISKGTKQHEILLKIIKMTILRFKSFVRHILIRLVRRKNAR